MEDRAVCVGFKDPKLELYRFAAVYDGHEGVHAADAAAEKLHVELEKGLLASSVQHARLAPEHIEAALADAFGAVDATFMQKAALEALNDGTTAVTALLLPQQILIGHVGDAKALLCQQVTPRSDDIDASDNVSCNTGNQDPHQAHSSTEGSEHTSDTGHDGHNQVPDRLLQARVLTVDHWPGRRDEQARLLAAGASITAASIGRPARLQGELTVSRAIGDRAYRQFGLISQPELRWQNRSGQDSWLVLASDGVFESLSEHDVCHVVAATEAGLILSDTMPAAPTPIPLLPVGHPQIPSALDAVDKVASPQSPAPNQPHTGAALADDALCSATPYDGDYDERNNAACRGADSFGPQRLQQAMADNILEAAYHAGSSDNLAAVVVNIAADASQQQATAQPRPSPASQSKHIAELSESSSCSTQASRSCTQADQVNGRQCSVQLSGTGSTGDLGTQAKLAARQFVRTDPQLHPLQALEMQEARGDLTPSTALVHGALVGGAGNSPKEQYRLLQCIAQLPRYAAHIHTDVAGLPVLSSSSIWLSHIVQSGHQVIVSVKSGPLQPQADVQSNIDLAQDSIAKSTDTQLMFSPGTMLQLAHTTASTTHTYHSALMQAWQMSVNASMSGPELAFSELDIFPEDPRGGLDGSSTALQAQPLVASVTSDQSKQDWQQYRKAQSFARGGFGEVWRAERVTAGQDTSEHFILKRVFTERGEHVRWAGLREAYFGNLFQQGSISLQPGSALEKDVPPEEQGDHVVRFVESFQRGSDLWLVFQDEGKSLHSLMYSTRAQQGRQTSSIPSSGPLANDDALSQHETLVKPMSNLQTDPEQAEDADPPQWVPMLEPSPWWWDLRTQATGDEVLRDLLRQMLLALQTLQAANVTHRDVKPENLLLNEVKRDGASSFGGASCCSHCNKTGNRSMSTCCHDQADTPLQDQCRHLHLRLIDFGSAINNHSVHNLYGPQGPSSAEQTVEYAPPEAVLGRYWSATPVLKRTWPYDMWSLGVVWLELLLGTPHVFQISPRAAALLNQQLQSDKKSEADVASAYFLHGLMELCIYPPRPHDIEQQQNAQQHSESPWLPDSHEDIQEELISWQSRQQAKSDLKSVKASPLEWRCSDAAIMQTIKSRDPTRQGLPNLAAVRLLLHLLHWNPAQRPTASEALRHAFFTLPIHAEAVLACAGNRAQAAWC